LLTSLMIERSDPALSSMLSVVQPSPDSLAIA
jgi:hypothetical protein